MKVDINILPEEHRPNKWALPLTVGLIIVILAAGYFGSFIYERNAAANSQLEDLQAQLDKVNAETQQVITESPIEEYQEEIAQVEAEIAKLENMERDYETINSEKIYWKPVLQTIREVVPSDIILTGFSQDDNEITIEGELSQDVENGLFVLHEYEKKLMERGIFSSFNFDTESDVTSEFQVDEDGKAAKVISFVILLEVEVGGTQ